MYLSFYGLKEEPFQLTPDPRFVHLAEPHRDSLVALLGGIIKRKGILLLTGPVGTGKTTLLHTVLEILVQKLTGNERIASALIVNPTLTRDEFLETMLDEFEVACPHTSKPKRMAALIEMLHQYQARGSTSVLIVDEAHLLTPELLQEIRLLSNLDVYREKLLQIVLCGQPELLKVVGSPEMAAIRQRIAVRRELRSLSQSETQAYIMQRLHYAGLRGNSPFTNSAVEAVHKYSRGVPRVINLLCDGALEKGFQSKSSNVGPDLVYDVALGLDVIDVSQPKAEEAVAGNARRSGTPLEILSQALREARQAAGGSDE
ncbi:MAG TPA: AAA family ATPase [Terriglobales bacterium]|nr:AAA family ATPase [Terriglobales bacterium]